MDVDEVQCILANLIDKVSWEVSVQYDYPSFQVGRSLFSTTTPHSKLGGLCSVRLPHIPSWEVSVQYDYPTFQVGRSLFSTTTPHSKLGGLCSVRLPLIPLSIAVLILMLLSISQQKPESTVTYTIAKPVSHPSNTGCSAHYCCRLIELC